MSEIKMVREKETKNKVRFAAEDETAAIESVYVDKTSPESKAKVLIVTISTVE